MASANSNSTGYGPRNRWENLMFDGDDSKYEQWEVKMLAYMRLKKLKKIIQPGDIPDADKNEEAFAELVQFLDETSLGLIIRDARDDGRKALKILREHYAGSGKPRIISLYTVLTSLQKASSESVTDYVMRAESAATALKNAEEVISDSLLIAMVMKGLPKDYQSFITVMTQTDRVLLFTDFKVSLRSFEETAKTPNFGSSSTIMKSNFKNNGDKHKITCYTCGKEGHKSTSCTTNKSSGGNNRKWCSYCRSPTHTDQACYKKKNDRAKKAVSNEHEFVFCVSDDEYLEMKEDSLLVDCGATTHIVNDEKYFITFDDSFEPEGHYIELADGSRSNNVAKKRGTVVVDITDENGIIRSTKLDNTLYIPSYPQNIFSVQAATQHGADIKFNMNSAELISKDGVKFPIHKQGRLYYLCRVSEAKKSCSLSQWHKIMGHCNYEDVVKLENKVDGMKITNKEAPHCSTCVLGKMTQSRSKKSDPRATSPLDFVHSDLCGPISPMSKDGHRYAISFTDDFSGATFIYFLKHKNDAVKALEQFLADSAPFGKMKRIRTDNGGEYVSEEFKDVLIKNLVKFEPSAPYSPHQNGTAERGWRTLFEMGRSMLIESELPKFLWTYAIMAAVHIRNRCYNQRTKETPYFLLTGRRPNLCKMNIFGTVCYPYVNGHKRKLEPRSKQGIFVGYDKGSAAFLVYHPEDRKVKKYGMVKFTSIFKRELQTQADNFDDNVENKDDDNVENKDDDNVENKDDDNVEKKDVDEDQAIEERNADIMENRYPKRSIKKPSYLNDYVNTVDTNVNIDFCYKVVPQTFKEAIQSDEADMWKTAMDEEMKSLVENDTFEVVKLPEGKKSVGGRWVYTVKPGVEGKDEYKARYVAKGYNQTYGVDYFSTFAPTARHSSIRIIMQIAAQCDYLIHQMDVKGAYLNAPIDCELFMNQAEGYEQTNQEMLVYRLHKSLYGLKQSASNWKDVISKFFLDHGCTQSTADPCIFTNFCDNETLI